MTLLVLASSILPAKQVHAYAFPETEYVEDEEKEQENEQIEYRTTTDSDFDSSQVEIITEAIDLRTVDTKTFLKADGTYVAVLYGDVVHYLENGKYEDIDNTLSYSQDTLSYSTRTNSFKVEFPESIEKDKEVRLTQGDYEIAWAIDVSDKASIAYSDSLEKSNDPKILTKTSQSVQYEQIMNGVAVEYIVTGSSVKENIILDKYVKDFSLSFTYSLTNLSLVLRDEGYYAFVNRDMEEVFRLDNLYMFDAKGEESFDVVLRVEDEKDGNYKVTVIPDSKWLETATYPVTIDPTISSATGALSINDTFVRENSTANYSRATYMYLCRAQTNQYKGLINFALPSYLLNKHITYAHLQLTKRIQTEGRTIGLYKNLSSFSPESVTWATAPSYQAAMADYHITSGASAYYRFDISNPVKQWVSEGITSVPGFTIKDKYDVGANNSVYSVQYSVSGSRPLIEIGYIDANGIKDYWTYATQDVGNAGVGYVSDLTGSLTFVRNDINFETSKQSIGLSMIYNSTQKDWNYGYGGGWQPSFNMIAGYDTSVSEYFVLDATGSKVFFRSYSGNIGDAKDAIVSSLIPSGSTATVMKAEDGSERLLIKIANASASVTAYYLLDSNLILYCFEIGYGSNAKLLSTISDRSCVEPLEIFLSRSAVNKLLITQIEDSSGNKIVLSYIDEGINNQARLIDAKLYLKITGAGYSSNSLEQVNYAYQYLSDISTYVMTQAEHKSNYDFDSIHSPIDKTVIQYDSDGRLESTFEYTDQAGKGVDYQYNTTTDKITSVVTWYHNSTNTISEHTYTYGEKRTKITDQDNHFVMMKFDDYGHTACIFDDRGNSESYAYLNLFNSIADNGAIYTYLDGTPNYDNNHKLVLASGPQITDINPLINPGFEFNLSQTYAGWSVEKDSFSISSANRTTTNKMMGAYSMRLRALGGGWVHAQQSLVLDAGTYTLSGYVKNATFDSGSTIDVYMDIIGASYSSEIQRVANDGVWRYTAMFFVVENDNTPVTVQLVNEDDGFAYFDGIQISNGFTMNRQNALENASFQDTDGLVLYGWTMSDSNVVRWSNTFLGENLSSILGSQGIRIIGSGTENRYAQTEIGRYLDLDPSNLPGVLTVGGWGRAENVVTSITPGDNYPRHFRIRVDTLDESSEVLDSQHISFDSSMSGWQYAFAEVSISEQCKQINLYLEFQGEGKVQFDAISANFESTFTRYEYDEFGRVTVVRESGGITTRTYEYPDDFTRIPSKVSAKGVSENVVATEITSDDERILSIEGTNATINYTYNDFGQITETRIGDSEHYYTTATTFSSEHDSQYVASTEDVFGQTTSYTTDILTGLLSSIENARGHISSYAYDDSGNLIETLALNESETLLSHTAYLYDANGRIVKICLEYDDSELPTYFYEITYDDYDRISQVSVNTSEIMNYTYRANNGYGMVQISQQTYANEDYIVFSYDNEDRVSEIHYYDSGNTNIVTYAYQYDQKGALAVYSESRLGILTSREYYAYDLHGRLSQITDESGNTINYTYDEQGNINTLKFVFEDFSSATTYEYYPQSNIEETSFSTLNGSLVSKKYEYESSALHRLSSIRLTINSLNIKQKFTYSFSRPRIQEVTFDIQEDGVIDSKYGYLYDTLGNIIRESFYSSGSGNLQLVQESYYEYDALNQLVVEDVWLLSGTSYTNVYEYDARGNRTGTYRYAFEYRKNGIIIPEASAPINEGVIAVTPYYNGIEIENTIFNVWLGISTPSPNIDLKTTQGIWYYDVSPVIISSNFDRYRKGYYSVTYQVETGGGINCTFTARFSIGSIHSEPGISTNYSTYVYDEEWLDQLTSYATIENGVTTNHVMTYDSQGNPTQITNFKYNGINYAIAYLEWDGRQLSTIKFAPIDDPTKKIEYQYNDQGNRTMKSYYNYSVSSHTWVLQNQVIYELLGNKVIYETNGTYGLLFHYDYDGTLIGFTGDLYIGDGFEGADYFYIRNQQGDITMIVDDQGAILVEYRYDAFGNRTIVFDGTDGILSTFNPYTYKGYRYDQEIGLYYLNSRYYDPIIGRFISSDGLLGQTGNILSTNMYAYCANNPVMFTDITGYLSEKLTNYILAGSLLATLLAVSAAGPIGVLAIVSGVASGVGQIFSNAVNNQPLDKNVVGAIVGGALTIALGPAGIFVGAAANAGLNAVENKNIFNEDISIESILYQFAVYSASNALARYLPTGDPLYSFVGFTAIDSGIYTVTDWAEEYVIDFISYVRGVKR
jgi:RHS repeat-associated protein